MLSLTSGSELRRFRRGRLPRLAVAAMLLVPLLYGALYLWAFWSPTSHLDRLPVALVNSDAGATRPDGTHLSAGSDLTDQLTDAGALDWRLTDPSDAAAGVQGGDYYFAVTIPADFSAALVSAGGDAPSSARIDVTYNDANSFIGTTLGRSAMTQVRDAVAATAGQEAVDQVLVGLGSARTGLAQASDGAVSLRDAVTQLADGAAQVADGAAQARDGSAALAERHGRAADRVRAGRRRERRAGRRRRAAVLGRPDRGRVERRPCGRRPAGGRRRARDGRHASTA